MRKGKTFRAKGIIVNVLKNNINLPRIGITVSKKVNKRAVKRNKLKRWIRETWRQNKTPNGFDVEFVVLPNKPFTYKTIKSQLDFLINKIKEEDYE